MMLKIRKRRKRRSKLKLRNKMRKLRTPNSKKRLTHPNWAKPWETALIEKLLLEYY
jgi:hypothetical protein